MPSPEAPAASEPLDPVAEFCEYIAEELAAGRLSIDKAAPNASVKSWSMVTTIPPAFDSFITSGQLSELAEVIRIRPLLFWHPVVLRVVFKCLLRDEPAEREGDDRRVKQLKQLIEAVAAGLLPHKRIDWKPALKRPGRQAGIENPFPVNGDPSTERISPTQLWSAWCVLKQDLERNDADGLLQVDPEEMGQHTEELSRLATKALQASDILWSGLCVWKTTEEHPRGWRKWSLSRRRGWVLFHTEPNWDGVELSSAVATALQTARISKWGIRERRAGYLAYGILAALLSDSPEKIGACIERVRNIVDRQMHPRQYPRRPKSPR